MLPLLCLIIYAFAITFSLFLHLFSLFFRFISLSLSPTQCLFLSFFSIYLYSVSSTLSAVPVCSLCLSDEHPTIVFHCHTAAVFLTYLVSPPHLCTIRYFSSLLCTYHNVVQRGTLLTVSFFSAV